jgi:hypothetical protein
MRKKHTLTGRVLAAIADHPGITATELRSAILDLSPGTLASRVAGLMNAGHIESAGFGRYRLTEKREATAAAVTPPAFVVPLARLMARR